MNIITTGNWQEVLTVPMFYGFSNSLLFSETHPLQALMALPIYLLSQNILITFNILILILMALAFFNMFLLAFYFTKKFWPSILAGIIYTFNPYVIGHFPDNLVHVSILWIPLIFLYFEKLLDKPNNKNGFLFFLFLTLNFLSTLSYTAVLSVIFPIYALIRLWQIKINPIKLINIGTLAGLLVLLGVVAAIGYPYISYFSKVSIDRRLIDTLSFAPWLSDLLFSAPNNLIYGSFRANMLEVFPNLVFKYFEHVERNLFWGFVPAIIFLGSFFIKKSEFSKLWLISVVLIFLVTIFTLGPQVRISKDFAFTGPYMVLYNIHPLIQNLRVSSRFYILTYLFLGLVCAFVLTKMGDNLKPKLRMWLYLMVISLVVLEYWSKPWQFSEIPIETRSFYENLEKQKDIEVILEFPMGNYFSGFSLTDKFFVDSNYMLYASTLHSKKLFNGYSSYTPPLYVERMEYLTVNFPNKVKVQKIKEWGVDAIVMHRDIFYAKDEYYRIKQELEKLGAQKVHESPNIVLFKL